MANIIAVIWDFDKTLLQGYMQDPIFKHYQIDGDTFWDEVNNLPEKYWKTQNVHVNRDTIYLNHFLHYVKSGKFKGLTNEKMRKFGEELEFYPGLPDFFKRTVDEVENNPRYSEYDIKVQHFVVSTGLLEIIKGCNIFPYIKDAWACEFIETTDENGEKTISEIGYTIDNTSKTRALFEINKGVAHMNEKPDNEINVNTKIPEASRKVHFKNMIYIADGPSDIPAFSVIKQFNGSTFAVYPKGNVEAMNQVEQLRREGRVHMYAEADYRENTTTDLWIRQKIKSLAEQIRNEEKAKLTKFANPPLKHL